MKSTKNEIQQGSQNKTKNAQTNASAPAQKDGLRYDYNDSSDFKNDHLS